MIRSITIALALVAGVTALAACGGSCPTPAAPSTSSDPSVAQMMDYERATCACKDLGCAVTARTTWRTWSKAHHDELAQAMTESTREMQLDAHRGRAEACWKARYDAGSEAERQAADEADEGSVTAAIAAMTKLSDRLCACKDMACAEQVMKDMSALDEPTAKPTPEEIERAMAIAQKMADCQKKLMEAEGTWPSGDRAP